MDLRRYTSITLGALILSIGSAHAQISYPSFNYVPNTPYQFGTGSDQIRLNGGAGSPSPVLRLTQNLPDQSSSAFYNTAQYLASGFSTKFNYTIADGTPGSIADGLAFIISNSTNGSSALGSGGGGLGFGGLPSTLGIAFDTFEFTGIPDIGVHVRDAQEAFDHYAPRNLNDLRGNHNVQVDFSSAAGGIGKLDVALDNFNVLSLAGFNLNPYLDTDGNALLGFGAATGLYSDRHDINSWEFSKGAGTPPGPGTPPPPPDPGNPPPADPGNTPPPPPPPVIDPVPDPIPDPGTPGAPGPISNDPGQNTPYGRPGHPGRPGRPGHPGHQPNCPPNSIPEPGTLALVGLGGLLALARRRR